MKYENKCPGCGDIVSGGEYQISGQGSGFLQSCRCSRIMVNPPPLGSMAHEIKASKNDQTKPDISLLPKVFLEAVAKAFMVGEKKYGRYNYCKGHEASQLIAAAQRHLTAWFEGEENDPIDGQPHLGSVGACIAMLLRQQELGTLKDNRYKGEEK